MNKTLLSAALATLFALPAAAPRAAPLPLKQAAVAPKPGIPKRPAIIKPLPHLAAKAGPGGKPVLVVPPARPSAQAASKPRAAAFKQGEFVVVFKKGVAKSAAAQSMATGSGKKINLAKSFDKLSAKAGKTFGLARSGKSLTTSQALALIKANPRVESVSLNYAKTPSAVTPNDVFFANYQWSLKNTGQTGGTAGADIKATEAWQQANNTGTTNAILAVLDTGVDYTHPDLQANMWVNAEESGNGGNPGVDDDGNGYIDDIHGIDTGEDDSDPMSTGDSHGTHVAGILGAVGNNSEGVAGVNWTTRIMAVKGFAADGYMYESDELEAIDYIIGMKNAGHNVVAVNASFGCTGCYSAPEEAAIQALGNAGILLVAAAGNESADNDSIPSYPANYNLPNVISVASTDHNDALSWFSNHGATKVHLAAPGSDILSTYRWQWYTPGSGTEFFFDDMESGAGAWINGLPWAITSEASHSPTQAWSDSPGGDYTDNQDAGLVGPAVNLTSVTGELLLGFQVRYDLAPADPGQTGDTLDIYFQNDLPGWTITTEQAHGGTHAWSDSPDGNYPNYSFNILTSPAMDLTPVAAGDTYMTFWLKGQIEAGYDFLNIYCNGDDGIWHPMGSVDGMVADWTQYSARVRTACRTPNAKIHIELAADYSVNYDGYYLDDVRVYDVDTDSDYFTDGMESGTNGWTREAWTNDYQGSVTGSSGGAFELFGVPIGTSYRAYPFRPFFMLHSDASTTADGVYLDNIGIGRPETVVQGYALLSGTSMAAPHVTGAAGFLHGLYGETGAALRTRILSATDAKGLPVATAGRLNLVKGLNPPQPCEGDFDHDGDVDAANYNTFKAAYGSRTGQPRYNAAADFDHDNDVDGTDLKVFRADYGRNDCP